MSSFYTYCYLDPRKPGDYNYGSYHFDYEPFYIGKGKGDRIKVHLREDANSSYNPHKVRKIQKIIKETGNNPIIYKLNENLEEQEAHSKEVELIKFIGRNDLKLGPLLNLTDGGEGSSGAIRSPEAIAKAVESRKGYKPSEETKRRISESNIGRTITEEQRVNLSEAHKGIKHSEETKKRLKELSTGRKHTKEAKDKISKTHKGVTKSIEHRKKLSEVNTGKVGRNKGKEFSDEWKKNLSEAHKNQKPTPESIAKGIATRKRNQELKRQQLLENKPLEVVVDNELTNLPA